MKRGPILCIAPCAALLLESMPPHLSAQDKPDFSGSWALESGSSGQDAPKTLSVSQSLVRTSVRGEPMNPFLKDIAITRVLASGTQSETYQIGVVGGTVPGGAGGSINGPWTHYRVTWEEQALVIESGTYTGRAPESGEWTARREVWSLDSSGRLHLAITTSSSGAAPRTVMLVYRRQ